MTLYKNYVFLSFPLFRDDNKGKTTIIEMIVWRFDTYFKIHANDVSCNIKHAIQFPLRQISCQSASKTFMWMKFHSLSIISPKHNTVEFYLPKVIRILSFKTKSLLSRIFSWLTDLKLLFSLLPMLPSAIHLIDFKTISNSILLRKETFNTSNLIRFIELKNYRNDISLKSDARVKNKADKVLINKWR